MAMTAATYVVYQHNGGGERERLECGVFMS